MERERPRAPEISNSDLLNAVKHALKVCNRNVTDARQVVEECICSCATTCKVLENLDLTFRFGFGPHTGSGCKEGVEEAEWYEWRLSQDDKKGLSIMVRR